MNVQVIADAAGRLVWASTALPGSTHDLTAARAHGIIDALTSANVMTFADKAYQGARGGVRTPFKRHSEWALTLLRKHRSLETQIRRLYKGIWEQAISDYRWQGEPGGLEAGAAREVAEELTQELHELRDEIARRGLTLPPLTGLDRQA